MRIPLAFLALLVLAQGKASRKADNPLDHLPPNIDILTHFGERADISPDNHSA
jgi:hypothetical protein